MRAAILLGAAILVLIALPAATTQEVEGVDATPCSTVRLGSYYYVVDGVRHDRLAGRVGTGDVFTLVANLEACGSAPQSVSMEFQLPPCQSALRDPRLQWVQDLNTPDVTDDAEPALVADLRAAVSCDPIIPQAFTSAAIVFVTLGTIGTLVAMAAIRQRRP